MLQSTAQYCSAKQSTTLYYKILFQYYSVLLCTTKDSSTTPYYKYYSSTTLYYKVLLQYYSTTTLHYKILERVARRHEKFAFYHSFERPTRTKWRKSCSDMGIICVLPQFWKSDTHCQIHRCDPCAPTEKEYILRLFQKILISCLSLQSFL